MQIFRVIECRTLQDSGVQDRSMLLKLGWLLCKINFPARKKGVSGGNFLYVPLFPGYNPFFPGGTVTKKMRYTCSDDLKW